MRKFARRTNTLFITCMIFFIFGDVAKAKDGLETAGDILQLVLPASAAGLTLAYQDNQGFWQGVESGTLTLGLTYAMKYSIDATRPNGGQHSFPSGHTSISFASAEFIRERYGWGFGIPAYAIASFVGYSRVESKQHYTRDVIAGALIGIGCSYFFTSPYKDWHFQPEVGNAFYGIGLSRCW